MGTWGTAISSNDTYADTYGKFFDLYNKGGEVTEISKKLITENQETINEPDDCNNFWFALAKAQWECKQLNEELLNLIKQVIETGADIEVWRKLDADEKDIKKRRIVLEKFLSDLQTERPKPKARKKKIIRKPVFEKGDCLTFKLENGNYGGAVILEAIYDSAYAYNLIATTRINQTNIPTLNDFAKAEVLITNYGNWDDQLGIYWFLPLRYKTIAHLINTVGKIEIELNYEMGGSGYGACADFEIFIISEVNRQIKSETVKPKPTTKKTIQELTKKNKWKLW